MTIRIWEIFSKYFRCACLWINHTFAHAPFITTLLLTYFDWHASVPIFLYACRHLNRHDENGDGDLRQRSSYASTFE